MSDYDVKFDLGLQKFEGQLRGLAAQITEFAERGLANIAAEAARTAAARTPRSDGPGPHIADHWVATPAVVPGAIAYDVHNTSEHGNEPIEILNGGGETTLLRILEYGSQPHDIAPFRAPHLVFFWDRIGEVVHAKLVKHPGTRPYGMLRLARAGASKSMAQLFRSIRSVVATGGKGGPRVVARRSPRELVA